MKKLVSGAWIVVGICVAVRIGADLISPVVVPFVTLVFVGSLFFWFFGRR